MRIGLGQLNTRVGAIDANTKKVLDCAARARDELHCDLVLFPELTLSGYPPEDLLLHRGLRNRVEEAFTQVREGVRGIAVYLGYPEYEGDAIYNGARDNASGVAMVLGIAKSFKALPTPPRRSILMLLVAGEEQGLLGSQYYGEHPTFAPGRIAARNSAFTRCLVSALAATLMVTMSESRATSSGLWA